MNLCDYIKPFFTSVSLLTGKVISLVSSFIWWGLRNQPWPAVWVVKVCSFGKMPQCNTAQVKQTHAYSGINPACVLMCCKNRPKGVLAMLGLESLQRSYHNDSLYYVDTVVVRFGEKPEFLFWQKLYCFTVFFRAVSKKLNDFVELKKIHTLRNKIPC